MLSDPNLAYAVFCPTAHCRRYVGVQPHCPQCGWQRPAAPVNPGHLICADLDLPILGKPQVFGATLLFTYGNVGDARGGVIAIGLHANTSQPTVQWQYQVNAGVPGGLALFSEGGISRAVFGDAKGHLYALRLSEAGPLLDYEMTLEGGISSAPLIVDNSSAYIGTLNGLLYRFDPRNGHEGKKTRRYGAVEASPAYDRSRQMAVFVLRDRKNNESNLVAFYGKHGNAVNLATRKNTHFYGAPIVYDDHVMIGSSTQGVLAFSLHDGSLAWQYPIHKNVRADMTLTHVLPTGAPRLFVPAHDHQLPVLDPRNGKKIWGHAEKRSLCAPPYVVQGLAMIGQVDGMVSAIEAADDAATRAVWAFNCSNDKLLLDSEFAVAASVLGGFASLGQHIVFGATNGRVYAMPLHGGNHLKAIELAEQAGLYEVAAAWKLRQGQSDQEIANYLNAKQHYILAGQLYEQLDRLSEAARAYEQQARRDQLPRYWDVARNVWLRIPDLKNAQRCVEEAAQLGKRPLIKVTVIEASALQVGLAAKVYIRVQNHKGYLARRLHVRLSIEDGGGSECERRELDQHSAWEEWMNILPGQAGSKELRIGWRSEDDLHNPMPEQFITQQVTVAAAHTPPVQVNVAKWFDGPARIIDIRDSVVQRPHFAGDDYTQTPSPEQWAQIVAELAQIRSALSQRADLPNRETLVQTVREAEVLAQQKQHPAWLTHLKTALKEIYSFVKDVGAGALANWLSS